MRLHNRQVSGESKGEKVMEEQAGRRRGCPYKYAIVMKNRRPTSKCQPYFTLSFAGKSENWAKSEQGMAGGAGGAGTGSDKPFFWQKNRKNTQKRKPAISHKREFLRIILFFYIFFLLEARWKQVFVT